MLNKDNQELCWKLLSRFGLRHQMMMVVEECSELQKAICKLFRAEDDEDPKLYEDFEEELIDTIVMCEQMRLMSRLSDEEINKRAADKMHKALEE